jgi:hypothetical protein
MKTLKNTITELLHEEGILCDVRETLETLERLFVSFREISLILEAYLTIPQEDSWCPFLLEAESTPGS